MSVLLPILLVLGLCQGHGARVQGVGSSRSFASSDIRQTGHIKLTPEAEDDKVLQLPGYDNRFTSSHYAGYVTVDEKRGRRLFYYFVESERDPAKDPVVLWLNGGPGCSSFDGFVFEQGPFTFELVGQGLGVRLSANPHAWSKVANMIFLDSPAGVGMSYSEHASDYVVDDARTAEDADAFLRGWFRRFPQYGNNDFYVSGESYAGIYVPNLVRQVLLGNEAAAQPHINIKGYLVGNGCTDERYDGNAHPPYAAGKSLLPAAGFRELHAACGGEFWNMSRGSRCQALWSDLSANLAGVNMYDTLEDCFHADGPYGSSPAGGRSWGSLLRAGPGGAAALRDALAGAGVSEDTWPVPGGVVREGKPVLNWAHVARRLGLVTLTPPCTDSRPADLWLNDPSVREAMHAAPVSSIGPWTLCSDKISYFRTHGSMIPIHVNNTKTHGLRALIYSGDHDYAVPHTGSEAWTSELGFPVERPWRPWFVADHQVAGYVVDYGHGLSYATVKGAGHMVPETNPREALAMFQRFIDGERLAK